MHTGQAEVYFLPWRKIFNVKILNVLLIYQKNSRKFSWFWTKNIPIYAKLRDSTKVFPLTYISLVPYFQNWPIFFWRVLSVLRFWMAEWFTLLPRLVSGPFTRNSGAICFWTFSGTWILYMSTVVWGKLGDVSGVTVLFHIVRNCSYILLCEWVLRSGLK